MNDKPAFDRRLRAAKPCVSQEGCPHIVATIRLLIRTGCRFGEHGSDGRKTI